MIQIVKKTILSAVVMMLIATSTSAQSYFNISGGPTFAMHKDALSVTPGAAEGSFGEGLQLNAYFGREIASNFSVEVGLKYTKGKELAVFDNSPVKDESGTSLGILNANAKSTTYGLSLTGRYDFGGLYAKAGVSTRFAGSTPNKVVVTGKLPTGAGLADAVLTSNRESTGKAPLGLIAAIGYQYNISDNIGIFVEGLYENIAIGSKVDKLQEGSNAKIGENKLTPEQFLAQLAQLEAAELVSPSAAALLKGLYEAETDTSSEPKSPYSSLGVQVGLSFRF